VPTPLRTCSALNSRLSIRAVVGPSPPNSTGLRGKSTPSWNSCQEKFIDKDRIAGAIRSVKGSIEEVLGKVVGDDKLRSDGKADQVAGKIQNAIGGIKDTLRK
jgi:uncharacterized protein YjbJ (UPF0337 family)